MRKNKEIVALLEELADIMEIQGVEWKPRAYRRAARGVDALKGDILKLWKEGRLEEVAGVGTHIAEHIAEYLKLGKSLYLQKLHKKIPKGLSEMLQIQSVGPKTVKLLKKKLKITSVAQLEKAIKQGKLKNLPGFEQKKQDNILKGIVLLRQGQERSLISKALPVAEELVLELKKLKEVKKIAIAGSLRRRKETIGDVDILVTSNKPEKVMEYFTEMDAVKRVLAKGPTRASVLLKTNVQVDLRVVENVAFGAALQYFTGSKDHNIRVRGIAKQKGYKLNEYGLFRTKTGKRVESLTEAAIYKRLNLPLLPPEIRETGAELKEKHSPKLVELKDIKGELHVHSNYSDGVSSMEEMIKAAIAMKYKFLAITDHSPLVRVANGLSVKRLEKKFKEFEKLKKKYKQITLFIGAEVDILEDGRLDYPDAVLKKLDLVIAAVHTRFTMPKAQMTKRIFRAIENKYVQILAHPTGRKIGTREAYQVDMLALFKKAKATATALEINSSHRRLDLGSEYVKQALDRGVKLVINTDAHHVDTLSYIRYGVFIARRGWAEKKDIINTYPLHKLKQFLQKKR